MVAWHCCCGPVAALCIMTGVCGERGLFSTRNPGSRDRKEKELWS
jgi:hypothetical protein